MPRRVHLATWIAFILNGLLILSARYRLSYDTYTHMLFGDHYRLDWWSTWEPRWYTGFEVTSYPPLVHQLIGLLGHLIGVDAAFALLLWTVLTLYPIAIYLFTRAFAGKTVSGYAALGAAVLPSIYLSAHAFGQLPTLTGTLFALFTVAALNDFLLHGNKLSGALSVALIGTVMAAHHATLLFLPWAIGALVIHLWLNQQQNKLILFKHLSVFAILAGISALLVIWPFWWWGMNQTMQTPIDHLSRHNFLRDPLALVTFFLPVYGTLIPLIPIVIWKRARRATLGLWLAFIGLFLLGLGGTTPLPRWLFGANWEWLTYDRFAFWASLILLPFLGMTLIYGRKGLTQNKKFSVFMRRRHYTLGVFISLGMIALISGLIPTLLPTQPAQVDMKPIVTFLEQDDRSQWRYITFGFGDQFAYLNRLTAATTIDGSYHTARGLPELRASGLGQIDTAYWIPQGLSMLDPILQKSGEHGVRWGFVNRADYIPVLAHNGWIQVTMLSNGVQVWENPQAILPPPVQPPAEDPLISFSWGVLPLLTLFVAGSLAAIRLRPLLAQNVLDGIHALTIGLLPIALCFWYFRTLVSIDHAKVYFTYDHALFFLSDGLALGALITWGLPHLFMPTIKTKSPRTTFWINLDFWFVILCGLITISIHWSRDWRVSLYVSLHWWLVYGLFASLQDRPAAWRTFALGSVAALLLQALIGFWQFAAQSTEFLSVLKMEWPGNLQPTTTAASVVQLADGVRWLRAYGSLPHPNILGGLVFVFIVGLSAYYLLSAKPPLWILPFAGAGVVLLLLTFSRSAWLGCTTCIIFLLWRAGSFDRRRLITLFGIFLITVIATIIPLRTLFLIRASVGSVPTEAFSSTARLWLTQESWLFFKEHPLTGLGAGAFILELAQRASYGYIVEPVHNIALLIISELGIGGGIIVMVLVSLIVWNAIKAPRPETIIFSGAMLGLGVISMFDHYLWTLAPGRMLLGLILGLFAGQARRDERGR